MLRVLRLVSKERSKAKTDINLERVISKHSNSKSLRAALSR